MQIDSGVRTLLKIAVILGCVFVALGLVFSFWSVPHQGFGSVADLEFPYFFMGLVLVVGGAIIAWLGYSDPERKTS
jgi:heme/copper-type cytochrome/quinol oxidase subunit 3